MAAAKDRKKRMLQHDKLRESRLPKSEFQIRETEEADTLLTKAQKQLDEEQDDVKHMN